MGDPPPPSGPPSGWYPDPAGQPGYRWWDGHAWTDTVTADLETEPTRHSPPDHPAGPVGSPLGPTGPWLSETFRIAANRSGHLLPIVLIFVLSLAVPMSFAVWYALRDTVISLDQETAAISIDYGGSWPWLIAVAVATPIAAVLSYLAKGAAIRQAWAVANEVPEPWSASVTETLARSGRIIGVSVARSLLYAGLAGAFVVGVVVNPGFVLLFPFVVALLLFVWVRLAFAGTVAALAGPDDRALATSWRLTGSHLGPLMGRLLLLAFVAANLILVFGLLGTPFTIIADVDAEPIDMSGETFPLNDVLGANAAGFALGSVFNALGLGASYMLVAIGTTLLYRRAGGPALDGVDQAGSDDQEVPG